MMAAVQDARSTVPTSEDLRPRARTSSEVQHHYDSSCRTLGRSLRAPPATATATEPINQTAEGICSTRSFAPSSALSLSFSVQVECSSRTTCLNLNARHAKNASATPQARPSESRSAKDSCTIHKGGS